MMATLITWSKRALCCVLLGLALNATAYAEVYPVRSPVAELGYEPWPGFRLPRYAAAFGPEPTPYGASERVSIPWLTANSDQPSPQPSKPETEASPADASWAEALRAAQEMDVSGVDRALASLKPQSRSVEEASNKLRFALAVHRGNRAQAERWYHEASWLDGGATGLRLAQWRALELGDVARLERAMGPREDRDRSQALLGWAAWMRGLPFDEPIAVQNAKDALQVWLAMLDARHALQAGQPDLAQAALQGVGDGPSGWQDTIRRLRQSNRSEPRAQANPDYEPVVQFFTGGDDAAALKGLDAWLETRPGSSLRAHAYFLRAQIHLGAERWPEASSDARAAGSLGNESLKQRSRLLRAILYGVQSEFAQAEESLRAVSASTWADANEAELLFYQQRLTRMRGKDSAGLVARLEEGYPGSPWLGLARADVNPEAWGEPVRVVPDWIETSVAAVRAPEIPREGPWQVLAFGPTYLADLASTLPQSAQSPLAANVSQPPMESVQADAPVGGVLGFGGGARTTGFVEGGFSGRLGSLEVKARGEAIRTEEPKRLPLSQRVAGSLHLEQSLSGGTWSLEGSGFGREEGAHRVDRLSETYDLAPIDGESLGGSFQWTSSTSAMGLEELVVRHRESRLSIPDRLAYRYRETELGAAVSRRVDNGRWRGTANVQWTRARSAEGERKVLSPNTRLERQWDSGLYVGAVGAAYDRDALLMPVLGYDRQVRPDLRLYAASEPQMKMGSFETTFFRNGDWNIPTLYRKPFRQDRDLRGGLEWRPKNRFAVGIQANWFSGKNFGTWSFEDGLWEETFLDRVEGTVVGAQLSMGSRLRLELRGERRWVEQNDAPVPFLASEYGEAKLSLGTGLYRLSTRWMAVRGRTDHLGERFGDFLRGDVELTYRSRRHLEYSLRIENIANAADRRWPGYPAYGRGVFGGLRWLFGSGG